jgi:hypothetical protein
VIPYSIAVTFIANDESRRFTVHIRPDGQTHTSERRAYFSEHDLRETLDGCGLGERCERIIAQAKENGICDLRGKAIHLDVARAAALGWYGDSRENEPRGSFRALDCDHGSETQRVGSK